MGDICEAVREDSNASSQENNIILRTETNESNLTPILEPNPLEISELRNEAINFIKTQGTPREEKAPAIIQQNYDLPMLFSENSEH